MYCTYTLTIACLKMFVRNRQALFFSLFMPTMILVIFGNMNFGGSSRMAIGLVTHAPDARTSSFIDQLHSFEAFSFKDGPLDSELGQLSRGDLTAVFDVPDDLLSPPSDAQGRQLKVYVNAGRPVESQTVISILDQFVDKASLAAAHAQPLFGIDRQTVNAHNLRYIEFLLPGVIAMAVMQMSVFSVAFVFALYKEKGILKRLLATPMRPYQFVTANIITRLFMSVAQAAIFVILGMELFHVHVAGSLWLVGICVVLGSLMFLGLGFTVSGLSKTMDTVPVLSNIVVFPMLFVGNVFFSASNLPAWLAPIAANLPLTFFSNSVRAVMTDGAGVVRIEKDLIGMAVWATVLIGLATLTFRFQEPQSA